MFWWRGRTNMGVIHHLILEHGVDEARAKALDQLQRQCVETAFAVMSDEEKRIGVMHAGFAMTALPHKSTQNSVWIRQGGDVKLRIESGVDVEDRPVGLPYGAVARIILLYLQTEAVRTKSREVELGKSMYYWLKNLGIDDGGKSYRLVREQARRLSLCRLTFYHVTGATTFVTNGSFVRDAIILTRDDAQLQLWREAVRLDEGFYKSLVEHPLPLREAAIRRVASRSMAIDVYVWLAYRLHRLSQNLFESAYCAGAGVGIGVSSGSKRERTPTKARRAAETSSRPARSRARPPQWDSQPKLLSTTQRRASTTKPSACGSRETTRWRIPWTFDHSRQRSAANAPS